MATLIPLDVLKDRMQIQSSTYDDVLSAVSEAMTDRIEEYVGPVVKRPSVILEADGGHHAVRVVDNVNAPGEALTVREWNGSAWVDLTASTDYVADPHRTPTAKHSGVLRRITAAREKIAWYPGVNTVQVTWAPGRFATEGDATEVFAQAAEVCIRAWYTQYQRGVAIELDGQYAEPRATWPTFALADAARDVLMGEAPKLVDMVT